MAKIAILSFYSGIVDRGVETFAYEISKRLKSRHKVTVFQAGVVNHQSGVRTYKINIKTNFPQSSKGIFGKLYLDKQSLRILIFTLRLMPHLVGNKFDVVIPLNGGWQIVLIRILTLFTKAKILISGHAGIGGDDAWNIFFKPDIFIALTSSQKSWANTISPELKVVKIPNGVDLAKFNPKTKPIELNLKKAKELVK